MEFNFDKFSKLLAKNREISEIFYYNAPLDISKNLEKYKSQQRFFDKIKRIPNFIDNPGLQCNPGADILT